MLHLTFAPNAHELLRPFGQTLRALWCDPFRSPVVVVPNACTEQWLRIRIAEMVSCCMALRMSTLEKTLWQSLCPDPEHRFLHKEGLQEIITALLDEELMATPCFAPVKQYCSGSSRRIDPLKRIALSSEIARLFLEYEYNRPSVWDFHQSGEGFWRVKGVDKTWIDGDKGYFSAQVDTVLRRQLEEHEAWQKALYQKIFGKNGLCGIYQKEELKIQNRYLTLPQLYMLRKNASFTVALPQVPLMLFLTGKVSHFHRNMLLDMSEQREVHLFLVNPCSEFWEDVATSRSGRSQKKWASPTAQGVLPIKKLTSDEYGEESFSGIHDATENQLLELWGASGKENVALWCQAAVYNFEYLVPDKRENNAKTLLGKVKNLILTREALPSGAGKDTDLSISFAAASDRYREIEALRSNVLSLLTNNPEYMLDDVVVYIPDIARYLPAIERVFSGYGHDDVGYLPITYASSTGKTGSVERAIVDFLLICDNTVTPASVFRFLRNDLVLQPLGISRGELSKWELIAERTGFCRGVDASHRKAMGDGAASASDEHTFLFSQARVLLCGLAVQPVSLDLEGGGTEAYVAPYNAVDGVEEEVLERYCATIDRLLNDCLQLRAFSGQASIVALCEKFRNTLFAWIAPHTGSDSIYLENVTDALHLIHWQETVAGRKQMSFEEFRHTISARLPKTRSGNVRMTGALTFSPLEEGYVIPCKAVFVAGMDSAAFPGMHVDTPYNLLTKKRIIGDMHTVRDNRYLFLELLCAAGDSIHISYQALDTKNDRRLPPSSIVQELAGCIGLRVPWLTDVSLEELIPIAGYETDAAVTWEHMYARVRAVEQSSKGKRMRFSRQIVKKELPETCSTGIDQKVQQIDIGDVGVFLRNPLEYKMARNLRLHNEEVDTLILTSDEPVKLDSRELTLVKQCLHDTIAGTVFCRDVNSKVLTRDDLVRTSFEIYQKIAADGSAPEGMFAELERLQLASWVSSCYAGLKAVADCSQEYRITPARACVSAENGKLLGSGCTIINGNEIDLIPIKNLVAVAITGKEAMIFRVGNKLRDLYPFCYTELWLTAMLLWQRGCEHVGVFITDSKHGEVTDWQLTRPEPWTKENAGAWFGEVVSSMLLENQAVHAPAVYFGDAVKRIHEFNEEFIVSILTAAETDQRHVNKTERRYRTFTDSVGMVEPVITSDHDELHAIYLRLLPLIRGKFIDAN